jgi:FKBP-type peptidyl-prolyl cis-trans isomerase
MGLFFRKKRQKTPTPAWVIWATIIFLIYAIATNRWQGNIEITPETEQTNVVQNMPAKDSTDELLSLGSIFNPEKFINLTALEGKYFPQTTIRLHIKDSKLGDGQTVFCGHKATINYRSFIEDGEEKNIKEIANEQNITFQAGEGKVMPALEKGVIGMRKNGTRTIFSPGNLAYGVKEFNRDDVPALADIRFEAELLDVSPEIPDYSAYRVLGDVSIASNISTCGELVKLHVALWDIEGKKLYSTRDNNGEPISFTIGKSEVFVGLEQAALGMSSGMHRNIIVPPSMQKTLHGNTPKIIFPFPDKQTVLVDIEYVL